ncbi:hypothetical protein QQ045_001972 [Rhodiola kirilowii]
MRRRQHTNAEPHHQPTLPPKPPPPPPPQDPPHAPHPPPPDLRSRIQHSPTTPNDHVVTQEIEIEGLVLLRILLADQSHSSSSGGGEILRNWTGADVSGNWTEIDSTGGPAVRVQKQAVVKEGLASGSQYN